MKKALLLIAVLILALSVMACGNDDDVVSITSPSDLDSPGMRIGVQNGTTGHIFANDNFADAEVVPYDTNSDAISALLVGDVDAVIMDNLPALEFVSQNYGNIIQLDEMLTHESYGIALQLGSPYTALFNDALDTLRADGTLDAIINYWAADYPGATRFVPGTNHPNGTLTMGTNADFPPFEFFEYGEIVGIDPSLARAIGDILGYYIEIVDMDFAGIIPAVQTGQVDFGMAGMTITDERREQVDFTQGYFMSGQSVIVRVVD